MKMRPLKSKEDCGGKGGRRAKPVGGKSILPLAFLCLLLAAFVLPGKTRAAEGVPSAGGPNEQEAATEKFLSQIEAALAQKFFDYRNRPVIRVAVFDFTDGSGSLVKGGLVWADIISRRLYPQPQFDVVSHEKVSSYLNWNSLGSLGKLDASGLRLLQRRINTMDPGNRIHALITGEVKRGVGRSLQVQAYLINFEFKVGQMELEKNLVDILPLSADIPLPTDQAIQEATEVLVRGEKHSPSEGRLLVLANTRGNALLETEYLSQFDKEQAFPWDKVPYVLAIAKEEATMPKQVQVGLGNVSLSPLAVPPNSLRRLEYSFLNGKCATNEVYFDEMIPAMGYRLVASFIDMKNNQTYSETTEVRVFPGTTTLVILSFYVPSEKERLRTRQTPRISVYQLFGKDLDILPKG